MELIQQAKGLLPLQIIFSMGALQDFDSFYQIKAANVTRIGPDCFNVSCDQYESDLDIQYITAIAVGIPTTFLAHPEGEWILDWAQQVATMNNPPLVNSISYGWPELEQCELTGECTTLGYNSVQYVMRTDDELKKLGTLGITVLVSSGDDGAASFYGSSGNCPIDATKYCPVGGCNYTSTACGAITIISIANNTQCFIPMGLSTDACIGIVSVQNFSDAVGQWAADNAECNINVDNDNDGNPHLYSTCTCDKLKQGTYFDLTFTAYVFNVSNGAVFTAEYPTSSPYVTSVSATQFLWNGETVSKEIPASITTHARITTGGGFSTFQPQPAYQGAAVNAYLKSGTPLPPAFAYNMSYRAYPDISFNGHNFLVSISNNSQDLDYCPCLQIPVDGTSASSPSLAGMISLINSQLLLNGTTPVGFINPAIYNLAMENPSAFIDINEGDNKCNRAYCCQYGWEAANGWDPVTGLGSPVFEQFLAYFLKTKKIIN